MLFDSCRPEISGPTNLEPHLNHPLVEADLLAQLVALTHRWSLVVVKDTFHDLYTPLVIDCSCAAIPTYIDLHRCQVSAEALRAAP